MDQPQLLPITKIVSETPFVKTFYFPHSLGNRAGLPAVALAKAGQFVMLWIPGLDQKPFSVGYDDGKKFGLTIFNRGPLTKKLFEMKIGDRVGISGPYGTSFTVAPKTHYIMVAGGYGAAPLGFLAEELSRCHPERSEGSLAHRTTDRDSSSASGLARNDSVTVDFCAGARDKDNLLFETRMKKLPNVTLHIATNDGSVGHKGFVTDLLPSLIQNYKGKNKIILVTCGPELMEKKVLDAANNFNVDCEVSIERYMKCGVGVCGQCCVDPLGLRMCQEGPVVKKALANKLTEFGKYHRDKSGAKIYF